MRRILTKKEKKQIGVREGEESDSIDDFLEKLMNYIPAPIVGAWIILDGLIKTAPESVRVNLYWIVLVVMFLLTTWYIRRELEKNDPHRNELGTPKSQIIVSTGAFVVWVFALGGPFAFWSWYLSLYGSIAAILYTIAAPAITDVIDNLS